MSFSTSMTPSGPASTEAVGQRVVFSINGFRKSFGGQVVLDRVDVDLREGADRYPYSGLLETVGLSRARRAAEVCVARVASRKGVRNTQKRSFSRHGITAERRRITIGATLDGSRELSRGLLLRVRSSIFVPCCVFCGQPSARAVRDGCPTFHSKTGVGMGLGRARARRGEADRPHCLTRSGTGPT